MEATLGILALWLAFAATHMALSSQRWRPALVARFGAQGFLGVYSLVALATFVPLVWLYFANKHAGPFLWYLGASTPVRWLMYAGMGAAFALMVGGFAQPSPASLGARNSETRGVLRLTRHPVFMGVGLFGLFHLLAARVNAAELAFFGGFPLFAVLGCRHQDQRKLASGDEAFRRFHTQTPFLPFTGRETLRGVAEAAVPLAAGVGVAALLRWFHPSLFG